MNYERNKELAKLGKQILKEERYTYIRESNIRIVYLSSDDSKKTKNKTIYAECVKIADLYKALAPYDFAIIFYPDGMELDEERQKILMRHELLHIGVESNGQLSIVPHDIEEFREIIERYGLEWVAEYER